MIYLYNHSGSKNHGCEAIVRSTTKILNQKSTLLSLRLTEDIQYKINEITDVIDVKDSKVSKGTLKYYLSAIEIKMKGSTILDTLFRKKEMFSLLKKGDVAVSIGGDTYCYPGYETLSNINYLFKKKNIKTVLWGCSIEPSLLNNKSIIKDMKRYDLITVRESLSYRALLEAGVTKNIVLCSDPAFTLNKVNLPLPQNFVEKNTVGINVSPLVMSCEKEKGMTKQSYIHLIEYIINSTDMNVALIPHVVWEDNDDREPLIEIYEKFKDTNRICMVEDCNCMELKGYISRCRFFIGARTHATIAAYSSYVPTIVLGYSVKAKGIAHDIFGTYENYVIPVQSLTDELELLKMFQWVVHNEHSIINHLKSIMPSYISNCYVPMQRLNDLI